MERDTANKYDGFENSNYPVRSTSSTYGQLEESSYGTENQLSTPPTNHNQSNNTWTKQFMNTANNQWNPSTNQPTGLTHSNQTVTSNNFTGLNSQQAPQMNSNQMRKSPNTSNNPLKPEEMAFFQNCSRTSFYTFNLPSLIGFIALKQYDSVKNLKPFTFSTILWQSTLFYLVTKFAATSFCLSKLFSENPNLKERLQGMQNQPPYNNMNNGFQTGSYQQSSPFNQSQQSSQIRNSPYLSPMAAQQTSKNTDGFVDDNYDAGGYSQK